MEKGFQKVMPDAERQSPHGRWRGRHRPVYWWMNPAGKSEKKRSPGRWEPEVEAFYGITGDRKMAVVIEMAAAPVFIWFRKRSETRL